MSDLPRYRYMCIRVLENGETEKPMHLESVPAYELDTAQARIRVLEAELEEAIANFADPSDKRRIRELEAALREAMEWNWGEVERLDIPKEVYDQMHNALHGLTAFECRGTTL